MSEHAYFVSYTFRAGADPFNTRTGNGDAVLRASATASTPEALVKALRDHVASAVAKDVGVPVEHVSIGLTCLTVLPTPDELKHEIGGDPDAKALSAAFHAGAPWEVYWEGNTFGTGSTDAELLECVQRVINGVDWAGDFSNTNARIDLIYMQPSESHVPIRLYLCSSGADWGSKNIESLWQEARAHGLRAGVMPLGLLLSTMKCNRARL